VNINRFQSIGLLFSLSLLVFSAFFNPLGVAPDYHAYVDFIKWARNSSLVSVLKSPFEPGFDLLVLALINLFKSNEFVFSSIVLLSAAPKLIFFNRISSNTAYALILILFFFKYFPLQDFNQVRAAISFVFLIFGYYFLIKNNTKLFLITSCMAILFHYSAAAIAMTIYVLRFNFVLNRRLIVLSAFGVFALLTLLSGLIVYSLADVVPRLSSYIGIFAPAVKNPFSPVFFPEFFLLVVSLYLWSDLSENMKRIVSLQMVGFAIFYGLYNFGVIGTRIREAISIFWLFYLVDFSRVNFQLKGAIVVFALMNIALGSYLFYFSNFLR
jgi:hypothetical protein